MWKADRPGFLSVVGGPWVVMPHLPLSGAVPGTSLWVLQGLPDAVLLTPASAPPSLEITHCSPKITAGSSSPPHVMPGREYICVLVGAREGGSHVTEVIRLWSHVDLHSSPSLATHSLSAFAQHQFCKVETLTPSWGCGHSIHTGYVVVSPVPGP